MTNSNSFNRQSVNAKPSQGEQNFSVVPNLVQLDQLLITAQRNRERQSALVWFSTESATFFKLCVTLRSSEPEQWELLSGPSPTKLTTVWVDKSYSVRQIYERLHQPAVAALDEQSPPSEGELVRERKEYASRVLQNLPLGLSSFNAGQSNANSPSANPRSA